MIFKPTFETFKKAMNKKKYLKGTLPTVFASVEKENLKKIILIERRETLFLSFRILMKI